MTADQIIEKEPRLLEVIEWLKAENQKAKFKTVYFCDVWIELKRKTTPLVGWDCNNKELQESREWDTIVRHLESLTPNMK
jgi:hypothetical protein